MLAESNQCLYCEDNTLDQFMPICGCYVICINCYNNFFGEGEEEKKVSCPICQGFDSRRELFVPVRGSGPDKDLDRANRRVNKVFNHSRGQFETLEKYSQYLEKKNEIAYKLANRIDLEKTEEAINNFELQNRAVIQQNAKGVHQDPAEKHLYIIEEYKRLCKNRLNRERLVDQYYRSYIDEKEFAERARMLCIDLTQPQPGAQNLLSAEIKPVRSYAYTPTESKRRGQVEEFQFPKPVIADMTLEKARHQSHRKLTTAEAYKASKEAGGWSSSMLLHRYQELAFGCLFVNPALTSIDATTPNATPTPLSNPVETLDENLDIVEVMDVVKSEPSDDS